MRIKFYHNLFFIYRKFYENFFPYRNHRPRTLFRCRETVNGPPEVLEKRQTPGFTRPWNWSRSGPIGGVGRDGSRNVPGKSPNTERQNGPVFLT